MLLAKITGTITATIKDERLSGHRLLIADIVDAEGKTLSSTRIAIDSLGAGVGDRVILSSGSAARMPQGYASLPVDLATIAIVDRIDHR
ncbi:EutN/CcmL family microcompartment protein [Thioalkalivibrio sp. HK1]|uniref:EutN/CcmL family microcompartment protein n=1 Tax=Thioalkalivibrio sp. HK1 TaxID=1469245 RepID=UPI00046FEA13|nr:EutN/CcmL family microcompartment protein [Thioalkalivibrio sp. HK1]